MIINIQHSGHLGDIIYSLSFVRSLLTKHGFEKAALYIRSDRENILAEGMTHLGGDVMISSQMFEFIKPVLVAQTYIHDAVHVSKDAIPRNVVNLDVFRDGLINLSAGNIKSWYYKVFGFIDQDTEGWITCDGTQRVDRFDIIVGRSTRYLNHGIDYGALSSLGVKIGYIGTDLEFDAFRSAYQRLDVKRLHVNDALEAASLIRESALYIGNQSLFFAIAEALNRPRLLESFEPCPNVVPCPGASGSFVTTSGMLRMASELLAVPVGTHACVDLVPNYQLSR